MKRGLLIAFEGIDGTGKSTQVQLAAEALTRRGFGVVTTREPTDGPWGQRIRQLYKNRNSVTPEEELALFIADRRQHVQTVIEPALAAGSLVLTDRYYLSTAAYQGAAGQDPVRIIAENESFAPLPDLVMLLTIPVALGVHRVRHLRGDTLNDFEQEETLARVAAIFAGLDGGYIRHIDASGTAAQVHALIMARIDSKLDGFATGRSATGFHFVCP